MLPRLQAERQLAAIEAACFPKLEASARKSILDRLARVARPREERPRSVSEELMKHMAVVHEEVPAKKRPRRRRDTAGHDEG